LYCEQRKDVRQRNRFVWFKKWVLERQTLKVLSRDSGYSQRTLQILFYEYLAQAPVLKIQNNRVLHMRMDGTYFKQFCLISYQDHHSNYTQLIRFSDEERYEEIKEDLQNLLRLGLKIESITVDGQKGTLRAIREVLAETKIQRCLVHIQRQSLIWLTNSPKHESAKELRKIVLLISKISTHNDKIAWLRQFKQWEIAHKSYYQQKSFNSETDRYWYTHKLLRRTFIYIKSAIPNMFHFLDDEAIPKTTNGIEGFFSHLKNHLDIHRGLTTEHRKNFIKWYIFFSNEK
jgi:Transposase, Mutator family